MVQGWHKQAVSVLSSFMAQNERIFIGLRRLPEPWHSASHLASNTNLSGYTSNQ